MRTAVMSLMPSAQVEESRAHQYLTCWSTIASYGTGSWPRAGTLGHCQFDRRAVWGQQKEPLVLHGHFHVSSSVHANGCERAPFQVVHAFLKDASSQYSTASMSECPFSSYGSSRRMSMGRRWVLPAPRSTPKRKARHLFIGLV